MTKNNFMPALLALSAAMAAGIFVFQLVFPSIPLTNLVWAALIYFILLTLVTFKITNSGLPKDNKTFFVRVYSAIGIRFVFSIFPLFIYLIFSPERQLSFAIVYLLLYFFYTAFEIYFLVVNLRPDLKK
ncbi:MAG: hypothetical protein K9H61_05420 [Bacteroidia bacterium]|nr:hypothetical protein [Bacteroidia bacterium]MCF8427222.1 hypothetical protein [Bacteroidia bacterium]MCF8446420.1 hypothetical protein [Bacteroidia bacterium]